MEVVDLDESLAKEKIAFITGIQDFLITMADQRNIKVASCQPIVEAFRQVPREEFVPDRLRHLTYSTRWPILPIEHSQTMSEAPLVAYMLLRLQPTKNDKVLDVGTGSGYQAALLSHLAGEVYTIERIPELVRKAEERLQRLGYQNVHVLVGDGTEELPQYGPFDKIIVAAGAPLETINIFLAQLNDNGRLVIPVGKIPTQETLYIIFKQQDGSVKIEKDIAVGFVALEGEKGWPVGTTQQIMIIRLRDQERKTGTPAETLMETQAAQLGMSVEQYWGFTPDVLERTS